MKKTSSPYIFVRRSKIHGTGVFAKKDIPKNTEIIEYVGDKITKKEAERRSELPIDRNKADSDHGAVYLFIINKRYDIDGFVPYNTARFINHSCEPNCEAINIGGKIWIVALKDIEIDEELSYNYGYAYDGEDEHRCLCRTAKPGVLAAAPGHGRPGPYRGAVGSGADGAALCPAPRRAGFQSAGLEPHRQRD